MAYRNYKTERKVIFAAMSKKNFFLREHTIRYILNSGFTPTCAFMMYSYFLLDTVERRKLIRANNDLIKRSDEVWVFGEVSSGVAKELVLAEKLKMPVKFFKLNGNKIDFVEIEKGDVIWERG